MVIMWDPIGSSCVAAEPSRLLRGLRRSYSVTRGECEICFASVVLLHHAGIHHLYARRECSPRAQRFNCRMSCCHRTIIPYDLSNI